MYFDGVEDPLDTDIRDGKKARDICGACAFLLGDDLCDFWIVSFCTLLNGEVLCTHNSARMLGNDCLRSGYSQWWPTGDCSEKHGTSSNLSDKMGLESSGSCS